MKTLLLSLLSISFLSGMELSTYQAAVPHGFYDHHTVSQKFLYAKTIEAGLSLKDMDQCKDLNGHIVWKGVPITIQKLVKKYYYSSLYVAYHHHCSQQNLVAGSINSVLSFMGHPHDAAYDGHPLLDNVHQYIPQISMIAQLQQSLPEDIIEAHIEKRLSVAKKIIPYKNSKFVCNKTIHAHNKRIHSLVTDQEILVSADSEEIKVWDYNTIMHAYSATTLPHPKYSIPHAKKLNAVVMSNTCIISGTDDGIKIWDKNTGVLQQSLRGNGRCNFVHALEVIDDKCVISLGIDTLRIWNLENNELILNRNIQMAVPRAVLSTHNGICCVGRDNLFSGQNAVNIFSVNDHTPDLHYQNAHQRFCISALVRLNENDIVSAGTDHTVKIWNINETNNQISLKRTYTIGSRIGAMHHCGDSSVALGTQKGMEIMMLSNKNASEKKRAYYEGNPCTAFANTPWHTIIAGTETGQIKIYGLDLPETISLPAIMLLGWAYKIKAQDKKEDASNKCVIQ